MKINSELIDAFLKNTEKDISLKNDIIAFSSMLFIVCIPTVYIGEYSKFAAYLIIPLFFFFYGWMAFVVFFSKNMFLFKAFFSVFISFVLFYSAYKIQSSRTTVDVYIIFIVIFTYISMCLLNICRTLKKIKEGFFVNHDSKKIDLIPYSIAFGGLGIIIARLLKKTASNDHVALFFIFLALFFGLSASNLTINFLKYYFIKKK